LVEGRVVYKKFFTQKQPKPVQLEYGTPNRKEPVEMGAGGT